MSSPITYKSISEAMSLMGIKATQDLDVAIHNLDTMHAAGAHKSPSFRTEYFTFMFITEGAGYYSVDDQEFELVTPIFYFTSPGHLKAYEVTQVWNGYCISATYEFMRQYCRGDISREFPFLLATSTPPLRLQLAMQARIEGLCQLMAREYEADSPLKASILGNFLDLLLLYIKELLRDTRLHIIPRNRPEEIVAQFHRVLDEQFRNLSLNDSQQRTDAQFLGDLLHLNPKHLSAMVKQQTGRTVSQWIIERCMTEARTLLHRTDMTVAEVAYQLGFQEPTNFTKYFKKYSGCTPKEYRHGAGITT